MKFIEDSLMAEVGRIAVTLGQVQFHLLSAGDQLLATRLGDQGIARLLLEGKHFGEICHTLIDLASAKRLNKEAIDILWMLLDEFSVDATLARNIANGSWTYLGGDSPKYYGLFEGEESKNGDLIPKWRSLQIKDLVELRERMELAYAHTKKFMHYCRLSSGIGRNENQTG